MQRAIERNIIRNRMRKEGYPKINRYLRGVWNSLVTEPRVRLRNKYRRKVKRGKRWGWLKRRRK